MRIPQILTASCVLAALLFVGGTARTAASDVRGDVNCSGAVDTQDVLDMLLAFASEEEVPDLPEPSGEDGTPESEDCLQLGLETPFGVGGDVTCDGLFNLLDPLTALKLFGGFPVHPCIELTIFGFGAVGGEIGPEGGTFSTTGLDGTEFSLEIPEGALLGPEQIKMTPIDEIADLPVPGGFVAAVDLQPSGLEFWDAVILTISPPADIQPSDQSPFIITGGEFVSHPLVLESEEMQLPLTHFGVAGVTQGPASELPPLSSPSDAYTAQAAALVLPQRAALLAGGSGDPQFASDLAALMAAYYDAYIAPGLDVSDANPAGLGACPVEIRVVGHALGLSGQAAQIGGGNFTAVMTALQALSPALAGCRQGDFNRCIQFHDIGAISRMVAYSRVMTMLGIEASPSPLDEMMRKCARFELNFLAWFCTDQVTSICSAGISYAFFTRTRPVFSMSVTPSGGALATVPLELLFGNWRPHRGCSGTMTSPGSTLKVLNGGVSMNSFSSRRPNNVPPIELVIHPGIPKETLPLTCDGKTDIQTDTLWWRKWCSFHSLEITPPHPDSANYCLHDEEGQWAFAITQTGWRKVRGLDNQWWRQILRTNTEAGVAEDGYETTRIVLTHLPLP